MRLLIWKNRRNYQRNLRWPHHAEYIVAIASVIKQRMIPNYWPILFLLHRRLKGLPCAGCRSVDGKCPAVGDICATYTCTLEHEVDFCFECPGFPCGKLNPSADRANKLPHNMKVFNLCYIKNYGLEKFVAQQPEIRKKYYNGKIIIGNGPHIE